MEIRIRKNVMRGDEDEIIETDDIVEINNLYKISITREGYLSVSTTAIAKSYSDRITVRPCAANVVEIQRCKFEER